MSELRDLIQARWPNHDWSQHDVDWKDLCNQRLHVHRRLMAGENPSLLLPELVAHTLQANGKVLKDLLVSAKMGQKWMWWSWTEKD